jgi:hypothetical protein
MTEAASAFETSENFFGLHGLTPQQTDVLIFAIMRI